MPDISVHFLSGGTMPFSLDRSRRRTLSCAAVLLFLGCGGASDSTAPPDQRQTSALRLLSVLSSAPALATTSVSFYAVRGKNTNVDLWYHARPGQRDSSKFAEFRLAGSSLDRRPDGSVIANGDSVRITMTITDPVHLVIDFQPSGLRFTAKDPARLKLFFGECGDDLDQNGQVDGNDDAVRQQLSIWKQETPLDPWIKLSSLVVKDDKEVEAELGGFTTRLDSLIQGSSGVSCFQMLSCCRTASSLPSTWPF
jgi:hypothetical protein